MDTEGNARDVVTFEIGDEEPGTRPKRRK